MRPENQRMKAFLASHGIKAMPKYIHEGSLRGLWRLYGAPNEQWTEELRSKLDALGFLDFQGQPLHRFSGNGGLFSVFVMGHNELLQSQTQRNTLQG